MTLELVHALVLCEDSKVRHSMTLWIEDNGAMDTLRRYLTKPAYTLVFIHKHNNQAYHDNFRDRGLLYGPGEFTY